MATSLHVLAMPVRPAVHKYLLRHLGTGYVLSKADRFGMFLFQLLRRQGTAEKKRGSREDCSATFEVDLRNFPFRQYGLTELTTYTIFHFNEFVDDLLKLELYVWVRTHCVHGLRHRLSVKEAIQEFQVIYDLTESDLSMETLRKSVYRNCPDVRPRKTPKSVVKSSQKTALLSQKSGVLSQRERLRALYQHLTALPLPIFDLTPVHFAAS